MVQFYVVRWHRRVRGEDPAGGGSQEGVDQGRGGEATGDHQQDQVQADQAPGQEES